MARNWIAGEKLSDAVAATRKINRKGTRVLINFIGEDVKSAGHAEKNMKEYLRIVDAINARRLDADMSIKVTQLCTEPGSRQCMGDIGRLLGRARKKKVFVWFDMESSPTTEKTIDMYLHFLRGNKRIGVCLQASLRRTKKDMRRVLAKGGVIRLVKGAYHEKSGIAFTSHSEIVRNYMSLLGMLFRSGRKFALGTHDDDIINAAVEMNRKYRRDVEFQTLNGIRKDLVERLASQGNKTAVYMPYGTEWLFYGIRRVRERKRNILLLLKSLF